MNRKGTPRGRPPLDAALARLGALRESLRGAGNRGRAGLFSCDGCVGWCCREGFNGMRATPLEAEAVVRHLEERGELEAALRRAAEAVDRWRLDGEPGSRRTYTCPFLTAGNRCGVHAVKPLGCVTFTPVRDGGCDQDGALLAESVEEAARLADGVPGGEGWSDLPLPLAVLRVAAGRRGGGARYRRLPRAEKQSRQ